jgi:Fe2+ or Zn2+ uptake regulation protein
MAISQIDSCLPLSKNGKNILLGMTESLVDRTLLQLSEAGLRITKQRKALLSTLAEADNPLSADETHAQLAKGTCDLVTVYRSLEQFEKIGVLQLGVRENGTKVYCLSHGHDHHHHLTCRSCGRTERVDLCMGDELEKVGKSYGFTDMTHVMEVFGTCPDCK